MVFLLDHLHLNSTEAEKGQPNTTVCTFSVDGRSEALTNTKLILRKILWEMLSKRHELIHHAVRHFDEFSPWSPPRLWRVFRGIMTDPSATDSLFLLDGLDECKERMRNDFLSNLALCFKDGEASSLKTITIILSSRSGLINRGPEFKDFATYLKLDEDRSLRQLIQKDIENYFRMTLSELLGSHWKDEDEIAIIAKSIADRSEGSFLWTALIMERAQKQFYGDIRHLEQILMECPPNLMASTINPCKDWITIRLK